MAQSQSASLLRIFLSETAKVNGDLAFEAIVLEAVRLKLAGATVLRGVLGFGASSHVHSARLLSLSDDLPVVVEIVDQRENIDKLIPFIEEHLSKGLVTIENIELIAHLGTTTQKDS